VRSIPLQSLASPKRNSKEVRQSVWVSLKVSRIPVVDPLVSVVVPNYNHGRFSRAFGVVRNKQSSQTEFYLSRRCFLGKAWLFARIFAQSSQGAWWCETEATADSASQRQWKKALNLSRVHVRLDR